MPVTAANYDDILELSEDPTLDESTRARMKTDLAAYQTQKQVGGAGALGGQAAFSTDEKNITRATVARSPMRISVDAMEAGGMHRPMSREDWGRQYRLRKEDVSKDVKRQIDAGMTQAYEEDDPGNTVVNLTQPIPGHEGEFYDELKREFDTAPGADRGALDKIAKAWGLKSESEAEVDGDPSAAYRKMIEEKGEQEKIDSGQAGIDQSLPSASRRTDLYAPPEFMPAGGGFGDYATATYYYEPPLDLVKEALREKLHGAADSLTEESDQYKRFADALWKETYEQAKAAGKAAVRTSYMNTDSWGKKIAKGQAEALEVVYPVASGIDKSLTGGLAMAALEGAVEDQGDRSARQSAVAAHPVLEAGGAIVGALAPGGLVGRTYSGTAGVFAGPGAGLAARLAGAGAGGIAAGGVSSVVPDLVHNLSEKAFSETPNYRQPMEIAERAAPAVALGGPFGVFGELLGTAAGKGVAMLREGRRGKALADLEQAGMTTGGLSGVKRSEALKKVTKRAAREQRFPEDVMLGEVEGGLSSLARKRGEQAGEVTMSSAHEPIASKKDILKFRSKPGREDVDEALFSAAEDAGVADELLMIRASKAADEIQEAARPRLRYGVQGKLNAYAGSPGEMLALRADPLMRALSAREPVAGGVPSERAARISEDLLNLVRNLVSSKSMKLTPSRGPVAETIAAPDPLSLNPIEDVVRGVRGRGSARQLGASGGAGAGRATRRYTTSDLSYAEQQMLARLVELIGERQLPAASGE